MVSNHFRGLGSVSPPLVHRIDADKGPYSSYIIYLVIEYPTSYIAYTYALHTCGGWRSRWRRRLIFFLSAADFALPSFGAYFSICDYPDAEVFVDFVSLVLSFFITKPEK